MLVETMSKCALLLVLPVLSTIAASDLEAFTERALAADGQCDSVAASDCALSAVQLRGQKKAVDQGTGESSGSCKAFGCIGYKRTHSCQCNAECRKHGNCCFDYNSTCASAGSCHVYGCGSHAHSQKCQCNAACAKFKDCCSDYHSTCAVRPEVGSCKAFGCGHYAHGQACQCNHHCSKYRDCCPDYSSICASASGSCHAYGCGSHSHSQKCQCNAACTKYKDCCSDHHSICAAKTQAGSCKAFGCGHYVHGQSCQCNHHCSKYGNCCHDYKSTCASRATGKVYGHPSTSKNYPTYPGFTLKLVEEFDHPLDLNSDPIWTWSDGGLIEGQIRYVQDAIKFEDGKMKVEVRKHGHAHVQQCSHAEVAMIPSKKLYSGEMRTKHNMFRYGRYEASIKAPSVKPGDTSTNGNYVATLFVFRDGKYKHWREIDVEITGNTIDSLHTNVLSAEHTGQWREDMGEEGDDKMGTNLRSRFHTYAIEWLPHRITWFFDGKVIREKKGGKIPIPSLSTKIMMNTWVFDDTALFGGKEIKNNHFPMHTEYDWFRFYKWDGDAHYPCEGMSTKCLTADDWYLSGNNPCDGIPQKDLLDGKRPCIAKCV